MYYKLNPILKYNLWGGEKLSKLYNQKPNKYGEAWIMSCINEENSPIGRGYFYKKRYLTLKDLFDANPNIVRKGYKGKFPLLIKLIDAEQDLSIQVHPSVKTEFWHVLNKKSSHLFMGFNSKTDKKEIEYTLKKGDITTCLNNIKVKNGDSYLINPGTIHAIGAGSFVLEIQRSADVTYRLYDYHRVDKNGKERELHINQALKVINYSKYKIKKGAKTGYLVKCPYFKVYKEDLNYEIGQYKTKDDSFNAIVVLSGEGKIKQRLHTSVIKTGDCIFIPASEGKYKILGKISFVIVSL